MTPHRDRAPQEVTPVRLDAAARAALPPASRAHAPTPPVPPAPLADVAPADDTAPSEEEIAHDVAIVRRRALGTAVYGVGALAMASSAGFADLNMWPALGLSAIPLTIFCSVATVAGSAWTWLGARRLRAAGISVFDAIDGAWRNVAERTPPARRAPVIPRASALEAPRPPREPALPAGTRAAIPAVGASPARATPRANAAHAPAARQQMPASPDVLASRWGTPVLRAVDDRAGVAQLVGELGPADREMIPDVLPTADLLVRRVGELATTLHQLDRDAPPSLVAAADARLVEARRTAGASPDADQARRLELLGRQVETLADLAQRREQLAARLESAGLMLQNMRLDLLRLRSAGIDAALGELTHATREAGALSRDIGRALDVAAELRKE